MVYDEILLSQFLIRQKSITPKECGIYEEIKSILKDFKAIEIDKNGVKNIFLYKNLGHSKKPKHICFAGHIDVVPEGDAKAWRYDPFGAIIEDGVMYGRGSSDMKSGVASFVIGMREFIDSLKEEKDMMLSILLTSDEEGDGIHGTKIVLEHLQDIDLLPSFAIVAEPSADAKVGDTIKIGRRGSINGKILIHGTQGHAAYPNKCVNPTELLGSKLGLIAGINLDNGDEHFPPSKLVITDMRGGMEVSNVTPESLKIMFNVRNSTHINEQSVRQYLQKVLDKIPYTLSFSQVVSFPFVNDIKNPYIQELIKSSKNVTSLNAKISTDGGTSDARYFATYKIPTCEIGVPNATIHAIDEHVRIEDIRNLKNIFKEFLKNIAK